MIAESPLLEAASLRLDLTLDDPELIHEILAVPEGPARERHLRAALRLGLLALRQASGAIDAGAVRQEGEHLLRELDQRLGVQLRENLAHMSEILRRYFDPSCGDLPQRLERLLRRDGELETLLARHLGGEDSTVARTLAAHIGANSPIFKLLSPEQSSGVIAALDRTIQGALLRQREQVLRQFSLDDPDSALSRLLRELAGRNVQLREGLSQDLNRVSAEFSLDNPDGALSRLVARVERAQRLMAEEFSLDHEGSALSRIARLLHSTRETVAARLTLDDDDSPLSRLRRELLDVVHALSKANQAFHTEVREAVAALSARRAEAARSTRHGCAFEEAVGQVLQAEAQRLGDIFEAVGGTTGAAPYCKVGDHVIVLGPDSAAPGARVICEAKEDKSYNLRKALDELQVARRNRQAQVGLFVFSRSTAPAGQEALLRQGSDIVVLWDSEDPASDVYLRAALSLARALVIRERVAVEQTAVDFSGIDQALGGLLRDVSHLEEVARLAGTVRSHGDKIVQRTERLRDDLARQIETLREHIDRLRPVRAITAA